MSQVIQADAANNDAANADAAQAALDGFASVDEPGSNEPKRVETEPVKTAVVEVADPKAAEEAAALAAAEKEWEGVAPKVRQMLEGISGKVGTIDALAHDVKSQAGRVGAALEGVHALKLSIEAAKAVTKAGGDAPSQQQIAAAAEDDAAWKELKDDFPQWVTGTEKLVDAKISKFASTLPASNIDGIKQELSGTVTEIVTKATSEAKAEARELAKIDRKYENWEEDIYADPVSRTLKPEFVAWESKQPPEVRALANSNRASDAIKMLEAFYADRKAVADATAKSQRNKTLVERAITPKGVSSASSNRNLTEEEAKLQGFLSVDT